MTGPAENSEWFPEDVEIVKRHSSSVVQEPTPIGKLFQEDPQLSIAPTTSADTNNSVNGSSFDAKDEHMCLRAAAIGFGLSLTFASARGIFLAVLYGQRFGFCARELIGGFQTGFRIAFPLYLPFFMFGGQVDCLTHYYGQPRTYEYDIP